MPTPTSPARPITAAVRIERRYPANADLAVSRILSDADFLASRFVEMHTAFVLLRAGHARKALEGQGFKYEPSECGDALIARAEAIYFGQSQDALGDPWKNQETHRILGSAPDSIGLKQGL